MQNPGAAGNSVGVVVPQRFQAADDFPLQCGEALHGFAMVYETYGALNAAGSNAVLICHALSGNHHAAGYHSKEDDKPGWWDACIGPGKAVDTNRFFVVCPNNLGGCHGSTGPGAVSPETGAAYGPAFPTVTVKDWVRSQALLADHLGIRRFAAVVGGSLGGMQAMQWAIDLPERVGAAVLIACAARLSAQNIAFNEIARQAITSDPQFQNGRYRATEGKPNSGIGLARMIGHVTYLSDHGMGRKFGRELKSGNIKAARDVEFQVESYLRHQARTFSQRFDANTYLLMTRALDFFDPAEDFDGDLVAALRQASADFLVLSFTTDWRFSAARSKEIVDALITARKNVVSANIESEHGHDSFLMPLPRYVSVFKAYMDRLAERTERGAADAP